MVNFEIKSEFREWHCAIALGSNLGDSLSILNQAINKIAHVAEIDLISRSTWHKTKPIGPPQPDYLNGCITIKTSLLPEELLKCLMDIEEQFGRERKERWGARTLDLDIILYDNQIIHSFFLKIPHPRMRERLFVLMPLTEIASGWVDPVTKLTISQLLDSCLKESM
ncbi:2-amino-4-hydroxy-6-hydroxymethyldihydropteridine pyrophosphokinase [Geminocystis sp. NIES-3708]|uniref:2-amino-4-hydroxy-6- hydroxymethyldihydropteridine diphosphokinase n=1 Tax=Geminocystis sp. NIES-3708 TaxID=1615909 RepID=UPI0005FC8115|nr:2-amino-4-hydroxy-6-hydroxymethyldihydropteridine diphosphokinase [Geminocystis sp. NIES-3708]BAQ63089.1 2-amino-4-hydroxy-6-hydroxymethyldihydropteridine pyrophosphokinase [Geminocystis sp. NIES-3708]